MIVEHLRRGKSIRSFAAIADVCHDTIYEWAKVHKPFSDAIRRGRSHQYAWWEEQGMNGLFESTIIEKDEASGTTTKTISKINSRMFELFMGNMFDWSRKQTIDQETTHKADSTSVAELAEKLAEVAKLAAE